MLPVWPSLTSGTVYHRLWPQMLQQTSKDPFIPPLVPLSVTFSSDSPAHPGLPGWAGTRKVKPVWILLKQETVSGSGISWAICKSAPRSRQVTTPASHRSVFTGRIPFLSPNQQRQSTNNDNNNNWPKRACADSETSASHLTSACRSRVDRSQSTGHADNSTSSSSLNNCSSTNSPTNYNGL